MAKKAEKMTVAEMARRFIEELTGVENSLESELGPHGDVSVEKNQRQLLFRTCLMLIRAQIFVLEVVLARSERMARQGQVGAVRVCDQDEKMTWGEFKAYVERGCEGLTDETPMGYISLALSTTFLCSRAGKIESDIDADGELCIW